MQFAKIVGQEAVKEQLIRTVTENRISHAQLFTGESGHGTLPLAMAYAQFVMCSNPQQKDSCGECASCKKIEKLVHPDLHFAYPTVGSKNSVASISDDYIAEWRKFIIDNAYGTYNQWLSAIDAGNSQGLIKVREAEQIVRKLSLKSFESEYKIMIIWFPEKMNAETANKLLKLIEEPPEKTLFLLVAKNAELIINTIRSRTQLFKVPRIKEESICDGLKTLHNIDNEKAKHISRISDGNFNTAQELIETSVEAKESFDVFTSMMRLSYIGKIIELVNWVDDVAQMVREKQKSLLIYALKMVRENLVINQETKDIARLSNDEMDFATKFSSFIHPGNAPQMMEEFSLAINHITRNANAKIVFLDLCIRLNRILKIPQ